MAESRPTSWTPPSCEDPWSSPTWEEALPRMAAAQLGLAVSQVISLFYTANTSIILTHLESKQIIRWNLMYLWEIKKSLGFVQQNTEKKILFYLITVDK